MSDRIFRLFFQAGFWVCLASALLRAYVQTFHPEASARDPLVALTCAFVFVGLVAMDDIYARLT